MSQTQENLIMGWVAKALDMLLEADEKFDMGVEWRKDLDALRVRYHNKINTN
jgi:hypothetical protein